MDIHSLLNPLGGEKSGRQHTKTPGPAVVSHSTPHDASLLRTKVAKDAPIFSDGNKIAGFVNYPPHESDDSRDLAAQHQRFQLYPRGEIYKKGVRHIPYNSDKKDFLEKTGREAFEMFQYTYKVPGDDKTYTVVWDYNVGLVRMTPFFKSCKYSKTVPAKALNQNPGMKDISYSITGGALVCQGYWMPYQAARAIAATFCYDIRYALTPIFGNEFPSMCLSPKDPGFAKFLIDPAIVRQCAAETERFKREKSSYQIDVPHLLSPMETPKMQFESPTWKPKAIKHQTARPATINNSSRPGTQGGYSSRPSTQGGYTSRPTTKSGYSPLTERHDDFVFSPHMSHSPRWNHINRPRTPNSLSPNVSPRSHFSTLNRSLPATPLAGNFVPMSSPPAHMGYVLPSIQMLTPMPDEEVAESFRTKRTHSKVTLRDTDTYEPAEEDMCRPQTADAAVPTEHDIEAAELLLSLGGGGSTLMHPPPKRIRRGSRM